MENTPVVEPVIEKSPEEKKYTRADILKMPATELRHLIANPDTRALINEVLSTVTKEEIEQVAQEPTAEELEKQEAEKAEAERIEAERVEAEREAARKETERVAAEKAEAERKEAERKEREKPKKIVLDYQAEDEDGNPIGNRTHLEAFSQEEMLEKVKHAHIQAVRAFNRLKRQKVTFNKEDPKPAELTEEQILELAKNARNEDPVVAAKATRDLVNAELEKERQELRIEKENARQIAVSNQFMRNHLEDFLPCEANGKLMSDFIKNNDLDWTIDNLEIAFTALESELAPAAKKVSIEPEPVIDLAPEPAPVPVVQAAPQEIKPAEPNPPAVVPPAAPVNPVRRPGVNAGIVPGETLSGVRPVNRPPALTKQDIRKMTPEEMRRRQRIDPTFYDKVNALFAKK